jgi:hypothetical protein
LFFKLIPFQYDVILSDDTQLEELIGRNVRLDYVNLSVASSDPIRYPLQQKWKSKSDQQSEEAETNQKGKLKQGWLKPVSGTVQVVLVLLKLTNKFEFN